MSKHLTPVFFAAALIVLAAGTALAAPGQEFRMGFKLLADQIPLVVGQPLENEHHNPANGDSLQQTTSGLMAWRKADNWTAFTNGSRTWVNGPSGVQERGNDQRFSWEGGDQSPTAPGVSAADLAAEQRGLELINQSRQQHGLPAVAADERLRSVARAHARDMSAGNFFSHTGSNGQSPFDRMRAAGIGYRTASENLGSSRGFASPSEGVRVNHERMMAETPPEDGHRRNILNGSFRKVGIGVFTGGDGKTYYVSEFTD